jgi:hypothetical protein
MNIFYLHSDPKQAAAYHCDKHVVKMILETAQVLSAVHARYDSQIDGMYKATHTKHPSTLWAGDNILHYRWLHRLGMYLCDEYTLRYGKIHKTQAVLELLSSPPIGIPLLSYQEPPQCMPDDCKVPLNAIAAYRNYYTTHKAYMAKWEKLKNMPNWFRKSLDLENHYV